MSNNLFIFQKTSVVHPHDRFLARTILKIFPRWMTPNFVSLIRLLGTAWVVFLILDNQLIWGIIVYALLAFTDAIDGSLARTRHQITNFGMLFDPLADKVLNGAVIILLVLNLLPLWLGFSLLGMEFMFICLALIVRFKDHRKIMANHWGKTKMWFEVVGLLAIFLHVILATPLLLTIAFYSFILALVFGLISFLSRGI